MLKFETRVPFDIDWEFLERYKLDESQFSELLRQAKLHVFCMGVGDAASQIGETVSQFFVAKMFYVQDKLGLPRSASVVQLPDATIQTYNVKFTRSVPEAAYIRWGQEAKEETEFVPAEIDVDFCGMIAVGMDKNMSSLELAENLIGMKERLKILDNWALDTNCIQPGNHFANVYEVRDHEKFNLPPFVGVAHMASDEYRNLMRDFVDKLSLKMATPFGDSMVLTAEAARKYWQIAQEGSYFSKKKREAIAREIFRSDCIFANDTHYEMVSPQSCVIGANRVNQIDNNYHVIVTKPTKEAYLVRATSTTDTLPHGSGHCLIEDRSLKRVKFTKEGILFVTDLMSGGERVVKHYQSVPTVSRKNVMHKVLEHGLIQEEFATLVPLCSVKI